MTSTDVKASKPRCGGSPPARCRRRPAWLLSSRARLCWKRRCKTSHVAKQARKSTWEGCSKRGFVQQQRSFFSSTWKGRRFASLSSKGPRFYSVVNLTTLCKCKLVTSFHLHSHAMPNRKTSLGPALNPRKGGVIDFRIAWLVGALVLVYGIVTFANSCEETSIELLLFTIAFFGARGFFKRWTEKDRAPSPTPSRRTQSNSETRSPQQNTEKASGVHTHFDRGCYSDIAECSAEELQTHIENTQRFHDFWGWTPEGADRVALWKKELQRKQGVT